MYESLEFGVQGGVEGLYSFVQTVGGFYGARGLRRVSYAEDRRRLADSPSSTPAICPRAHSGLSCYPALKADQSDQRRVPTP